VPDTAATAGSLAKSRISCRSESDMELIDLSNLRPAPGSRKPRKRSAAASARAPARRRARPQGSRRALGRQYPAGLRGRQMPLQRRLPKFGFTNPTRRPTRSSR
jgi:ribosomal protein L15